MILDFVEQWERKKHLIEESYATKKPETYKDLVVELIKILDEPMKKYKERYESCYKQFKGECIDTSEIHEIDFGGGAGDLVYLFFSKNRRTYWETTIEYGSCSFCDSLEQATSVEDYMTLTLHLLQHLKEIDDERVFYLLGYNCYYKEVVKRRSFS